VRASELDEKLRASWSSRATSWPDRCTSRPNQWTISGHNSCS